MDVRNKISGLVLCYKELDSLKGVATYALNRSGSGEICSQLLALMVTASEPVHRVLCETMC